MRMHSHTGCFCLAFSIVCFQMSPQMACHRWCIITLVASVWLFSTVSFQMPSQIVMGRGIVTKVAFVWLFPTVFFQMSPQIACLWRCKVTLVAFVWLFSTVRFQMSPQIACLRRGIVTLLTFVWLFATVCFQNPVWSNLLLRSKFKSCWGHGWRCGH